ncbi:MAG: hypothetical protein M1821_004474 [Bathelium mastoideum]|nr:MAG: hypothetical protein M1821_004474 [Bathelium mastoideum]
MQKAIEKGNPSQKGETAWTEFWIDPNRANVDNVVADHKDFLKKIPKIDRDAIRNLNQNELERLMSQTLKEAVGGKTRHHNEKAFVRQTGRNAVKFARTFSDYLEAYSGIIEIMNGADQQYGGVAYATISLFLIIAVNKDRKEKRIDELLRALQREFIRVQTVKQVHGTPTMQGLICDAFIESIMFLRWATRYYAQPSWVRVMEAITRPPKVELDQSTAKIACAVVEIEKERDTLDSKRLFEVQSELGDVRRTVDDMRLRVEGTQNKSGLKHSDLANRSVTDIEARDEGALLNRLKELIEPPVEDRAGRLAEYQRALDGAFQNMRRFSPFEMQVLEDQKAYQIWSRNFPSSLLLLYGETRAHAGHCCWLSPALFSVVGQAQSQGKIVAWFCCQKDATLNDSVSITTIVRDLVDQLLEQSRSQLRKQAWYEEILPYAKTVSNGTPDLSVLFALLQKVSQAFSEVLLVIDRSDLVRGETWNWLQHFVSAIKNSSQTLRVLLIASSNGNTEPNGKLESQVFGDLEAELHHRFLKLELNNF